MKPIEIHPPGNRNITVKIYRVKDGSTASGTSFQVADYTSGKRKLHTFADESDARNKAGEIAVQLDRGDKQALALTNEEASDYRQAATFVKPTGVALPTAARHYAEAFKILGADLVIEAAREYKKRHGKLTANKTVPEVFDLLMADARARKLSVRYIEDLQYRAGKFAESFKVPIGSVSGDEIREFLASLKTTQRDENGKTSQPLSARSYNNFLRAVRRLFEFAKARKFVTADHDELTGIDPIKERDGDIEIYTPEEMSRLLSAADDDILPAFAIGAFAGLRSAEIERLDWREVNLDERFIEVKAGKAKTAARRVVPINDNLAAWLQPLAQKSGLVWELGHAYFYQRIRETAEATGGEAVKPIQWKHNALRHSFISYRVAHTQNVNQVALEAGNSPSMIFQHYRELVTQKQAAIWFSIAPSGSEPMPKLAVAAAP